MKLNDDLRDMALNRYGYGAWNAPYWFLGLEESSGREETNDLAERLELWRAMGSHTLDDCRNFHEQLAMLMKKRNRLLGEDVTLQPTWIKLMLTLRSYMGNLRENEPYGARMNYQKEVWGRQPGETCVLDLSGLSARAAQGDIPHDLFRKERIMVIRARILSYRPKFVVLYGNTRRETTEQITLGTDKMAAVTSTYGNFMKFGSTVMVMMPHPSSFGPTNNDWMEIGTTLRHLVDEAAGK